MVSAPVFIVSFAFAYIVGALYGYHVGRRGGMATARLRCAAHVPPTADLVTIGGREAFVWLENGETRTWLFAEEK